MAGKTFEYTISAVDKATATIERVNRSIDRMTAPFRALSKSTKALADASGLTKLSKSLGDVAKHADRAARSVTKIAAPLLAIVGGGTLAGLSDMVTHWERIGAETERTSRLIGITANELTQMRGAANLMGVSADSMTAGLQSLQDTLQDARWGRNQGAFATLQALGITLKTTKNGAIDTHPALVDLADRMQRIQKRDPAAARNLARSLGVEQLLPVLVQGRAAMQQYEAEARRLRGDFTPDMATRAQGFARSLSRMGAATDGLKTSIADRLTPVLQPLIDRLTEWIAKNREMIGQHVAAIVQRIADALSKVDWDKFADSLTRAVSEILDFAGSVANLVEHLGGWKTVATALALYMGGGFVASIAATIASVVMLGIRLAGLIRAWGAAGRAAGTAAEVMAGAGGGLLARAGGALGGLLTSPLAVGAGLMGYSPNLNTGEGEQLKRIRAAEAASGGQWTGANFQPADATKNATVTQWAQKLNFAGLEKQYGLPSGLLSAVAQTESHGNASAVSPAGAAGLFQFMPKTAAEYGINALDPAQSANAAAKKLAGLMSHYHGNLSSALSAYNWGEGNLDRKGITNAPAETLAYAPKVMALLGPDGGMNAGAPMPPLNTPPPPQAVIAPPVVNVTTRVHVERDGRTAVRTETPNGLHVAYPMAGAS